MNPIIKVEDLTQTYSDGTRAVQGVSFNIEEGEFFGFLGPNGAGKSTTIKVLTTLLHKTSGKVLIAGYNLDREAKEIRRVIGVQNQEIAIDEDFTGRENLTLQGRLQHVNRSTLKQRVNELLRIVGLEDVADKRAGLYSGGMKKRLDLASSLVHRPKILFLDEPTTGLDPQSRASIWSYLRKLNREEGITIFLTTQYMEEADRLCLRLSIIDHGQIVAQGSPAELKSQIGADTLTLTFENGESDEKMLEKVKNVLSHTNGIQDIMHNDGAFTVYVKNGGLKVPEIVRLLDAANLKLAAVTLASPTLDDVFLKYTGRRIRPEELKKQTPTNMMLRRRR